MNSINLYDDAHLFVAALRVIAHRRRTPPGVAEVCELLGLSTERALYLLRRLAEERIVETIRQHDEDRIFIKDHLKIESLPRSEATSHLDKALQDFQAKQDRMSRKVDAIRTSQKKKKQDLFADLESKLRNGLKGDPKK